jgi:hypothetical protein
LEKTEAIINCVGYKDVRSIETTHEGRESAVESNALFVRNLTRTLVKSKF